MGLAIGMTCASLAFLFIRHEISVDQFHNKIEKLYRIVVVGQTRDESHHKKVRLDVIASRVRLLRKYDEVKNVVRLMPWRGKIPHNHTWIREDRIWFTDPHIFDLLTLPLLRGDAKTALRNSYSIVLTPAMANKYFGDEDPVGKTLKIHMSTFAALYTFTVTGILEPLPETSSIRIDFLAHIPFEKLTADQRKISRTMSMWVYAMIFVELSHPSALGLVQEKLKNLYCHDPEKSMGLEQMAFEIHPFNHSYLRSKARYLGSIADLCVGEEAIRSGSVQRLVLIAIFGGVALVFSMLNFTMLSITRFVHRREAGMLHGGIRLIDGSCHSARPWAH